jgi:hypothetical protein
MLVLQHFSKSSEQSCSKIVSNYVQVLDIKRV